MLVCAVDELEWRARVLWRTVRVGERWYRRRSIHCVEMDEVGGGGGWRRTDEEEAIEEVMDAVEESEVVTGDESDSSWRHWLSMKVRRGEDVLLLASWVMAICTALAERDDRGGGG